MNIQKINARLDAVEDLIDHQYETDVFRSKISKLPDLEKLLAKLYTYSIKHKVKAIYFENVSLNKLKEFRQVTKTLKGLSELISSLQNKKENFKSTRLQLLLTDDSDGGLYPSDIVQVIKDFEKMIVWKKTQGGDEEIPEP
jgi:DNA mismatch repair ATPase MutS